LATVPFSHFVSNSVGVESIWTVCFTQSYTALGRNLANQRQMVPPIRYPPAPLPSAQTKVFQDSAISVDKSASLRSNSRSNTAAIIEQPGTSTGLKEKNQRPTAANWVFKKLARSYLDKRAPPAPESVRELWEYVDVLDLKTVFTWRDEVGIRRGVLCEDGKVEFDKWPAPPHEDIIDIFENVFKRQLARRIKDSRKSKTILLLTLTRLKGDYIRSSTNSRPLLEQ
jgi:hypothetical protein